MIAVILIVAAVYTLPNFYGESPAVQVSPGKATVKVTEQTLKTVEDALAAAQIKPNGVFFEQGAQQNSVRVRFAPTDGELQLRSRDVLEKALNPDPADPSYIVALNLVPNTPTWLLKINALPMYLGLDLRGGVHFLLAVDMKAAVTKRIEAATGEVEHCFVTIRSVMPVLSVSATHLKSLSAMSRILKRLWMFSVTVRPISPLRKKIRTASS